ncbi:MAG: adenine deaminase C-terminal domain-containing protein [Desulfobacterales bacterium]
MDIQTTKSLMQVAAGAEPADKVIIHAALVNVFTGELLEGFSVGIKGERIAYTGPDAGYMIGPATHVIDAGGKPLIPGFIDGHTHILWMTTPEEFLKNALSGGTTTMVTEIFEPYPVAGIDGVNELLAALADQPVKIFATAPAMVSISRRSRAIRQADLESLLERTEILGLGESYWQGILQSPEAYLPAFQLTREHRKTLEGHSAGAGEKKLNAYAATGISSCHEPITPAEAIDRLRLGFYVMVREGSVRRDLEAIAEIKDAGVDLRRLVLVSDGLSPAELAKYGYMEHIVQKAIGCGFAPVDAIRMATLNVAEHFGVDDRVGAIAPGRYADMAIIPDMETISPELVISSGEIIARNGKALATAKSHVFSSKSRQTIRLHRRLEAKDFEINAAPRKSAHTVRVIELVTDLVTRECLMELPAENGRIKIPDADNIQKIAAIDRAHTPGDMFVGLIKGLGLASGAFATSATWDSADIIAAGADEADMALAVNRIQALNGGVVVCSQGHILAEMPLPIFGVISDQPAKAVEEQAAAIDEALAELGVSLRDPALTLATLTTAAIPFFRICEEGYVNLKDGSTSGLFV